MRSAGLERLQRQLRKRIAIAGISELEIARDAGLPRDAVRDILRGKSKEPSVFRVSAIARELGTSVESLLGEAPAEPKTVSGLALVPELDVKAGAGAGAGLTEVADPHEGDGVTGLYGFPERGFSELYGAPADRVRIIAVIGDSMAPSLVPGDRVMVDATDRNPTPPGIFIVWDGLGIVVKRVEFIPHSDPPRVRMSSDNPRYQPYERPLGEAFILGRVVARWGRV